MSMKNMATYKNYFYMTMNQLSNILYNTSQNNYVQFKR
jgi:hypothetical protein